VLYKDVAPREVKTCLF